MKLFIRTFIAFFLVIFGGVFILQLPFTKNQIKESLTSLAQKKGIDLQIEKLDGNLPFDWILKGVTYQYNDQAILLGEVKLRLAILPLLRKQLEVSYLKMEKGRYGEIPFSGHAQGRIDLNGKEPIKVSHFLVEGEDLFVRLEGKIGIDLSLLEGNLAFQLPHLSMFSPSISDGSAMGLAQVTSKKAHIECLFNNLIVEGHPLEKSRLSIDAEKQLNRWEGRAEITSGHKELPVEGYFNFSLNPTYNIFSITDFNLSGEGMELFGKIDLDPSLKCLEGIVYARAFDLKPLRPFFPDSYIKGRLGAKIEFQSYSKFQDLNCQIELEEFGFEDNVCEALTIETHFYDLFGDFRGEFSIEGSNARYNEIELVDFEMKSTFEPNASPFEFAVRGNWQNPIAIQGNGNWQKRGNGVFFNINQFKGGAFKHPFSLRDPFTIEWDPSHFKMSNFAIDIDKGMLHARIDLTKTTSLFKLHAKDFPLEFIPLPKAHVSLIGTGDFDIDLIAWEKSVQGTCHGALKRALLRPEGSDPLVTKGSFQIHLQNDTAQVFTDLKAKNGQFLHFQGTLPILYEHFPLKITLNPEKTLSAQVVAEGNIDDLLNFINIGQHRIEGWLSANLNLSKTLKSPIIKGDLYVQDGLYENYYTGTHLKNIDLHAKAKNQTLEILHIHASDGNKGSVEGDGKIVLNKKDDFPFTINAKLTNLETVSFDTITGKFSGNLTISGNRHGSKAEGNLAVSEATFRIPDRLPTTLPELPIKFVNPPEIIIRNKLPSDISSEMKLDLNLDVPGKAFVEGRGMHSELKGKLHIKGTYTDIVAKGTLQLISGEYIFSGKVFDLTQGELIFKDKPTPSAYISLSGNCDLPDVNVTVLLRGPLTAPKLSFQSSPSLPTSSLLSQILFNKDISEITAVQALQLAQTVISLSGNTAPDILEKIRKTLGIDRLTILTSENDPGKISLQIGKYLMRGVLLTLSQGAESRNVSVEVDLTKGLRLQVELDEELKRKFSLKWHYHY